ncbi:MAG: CAP domain-containing protein [Candidatus Staskawiczbacteria bacterium]|nr:CAP domain-containing protein [Candidatus Staskawiczbacteria bacterium]
MKIKIVILILIIATFGAGIYFSAQGGPAEGWRDNLIGYFNNFSKQFQTQVQNFQKTDIGLVISKAGRQILSPAPLNIGGASNNVVLLQSKIIAETNLQRKENGNFPTLKENAKLDQAASAKANDMFKNQYFEHLSPAGVDPGKLAQSFGYDYIVEGENLILGNFSSEKEVVQDWMNSPGHRANILNNRYTEIGVAVVKGTYKGETVWIGVQEFGLPLSSCVQPDVNLENKISSNKTQLDAMSLQIDEKKSQIENTTKNAVTYNQMVNDYNKLVAQYNLLAETLKSIIAQYNGQVNNFNNCVAGK